MNTEFELTQELMDKINSFSRKKLTKEEVYTFPVILCDNEVDRDFERFSADALSELSRLFVGKTGIFDHDPKGGNQNARIFDVCVMTDTESETKAGEPYCALVGKAYMVRTAGNADLIAEIDGGIKKEVSVSCSVRSKKCSICGTELTHKSCRHIRGKSYSGRICHTVLSLPDDAYEWSFVAVPAQRNAGVSKTMSAEQDKDPAADRSVREELTARIISRSWLLQPQLALAEYKSFLDSLSISELCRMRDSLYEKSLPCFTSELAAGQGTRQPADSNKSYKI